MTVLITWVSDELTSLDARSATCLDTCWPGSARSRDDTNCTLLCNNKTWSLQMLNTWCRNNIVHIYNTLNLTLNTWYWHAFFQLNIKSNSFFWSFQITFKYFFQPDSEMPGVERIWSAPRLGCCHRQDCCCPVQPKSTKTNKLSWLVQS